MLFIQELLCHDDNRYTPLLDLNPTEKRRHGQAISNFSARVRSGDAVSHRKESPSGDRAEAFCEHQAGLMRSRSYTS